MKEILNDAQVPICINKFDVCSFKIKRIIFELSAFEGFVTIIAFDGFKEVGYEMIKFFLLFLYLRLILCFHLFVVLTVGKMSEFLTNSHMYYGLLAESIMKHRFLDK